MPSRKIQIVALVLMVLAMVVGVGMFANLRMQPREKPIEPPDGSNQPARAAPTGPKQPSPFDIDLVPPSELPKGLKPPDAADPGPEVRPSGGMDNKPSDYFTWLRTMAIIIAWIVARLLAW